LRSSPAPPIRSVDMAKKNHKLWESKWRLLSAKSEKIGVGGQGVVRKVENIETQEIGALKELINFTNAERRKRMHIEAASLSVLNHEQIAKLLDANTTSEGQLYIVTKFIDGQTLENRISDNVLSLEDTLEFAKKILSAIHHAHSVGVFHRDIKPENILLRNCSYRDPVLIDFGISFNDEENLFSAATFTGQQIGNRFLHLPELHRGARDPRSDLTQLCGVVLYLLTGQCPISLLDDSGNLPHQNETTRNKLADAVDNDTHRERLLRIFDRAFQTKLDNRWQTAKELISAFENTMTENTNTDGDDFKAIRTKLESNPRRSSQILTQNLYNQFMEQTRNVLRAICQELGNNLVSQKQGGARQDLAKGEFGSSFGITVPDNEVYLRLNGKLLGDELVMRIEDDDITLARLIAENPDWAPYREQLKREIGSRLSQQMQSI
ncbi:serine/threonine protein kinase, partial [bacterium]|nr:serine/threonine protein kinase [bacterium]